MAPQAAARCSASAETGSRPGPRRGRKHPSAACRRKGGCAGVFAGDTITPCRGRRRRGRCVRCSSAWLTEPSSKPVKPPRLRADHHRLGLPASVDQRVAHPESAPGAAPRRPANRPPDKGPPPGPEGAVRQPRGRPDRTRRPALRRLRAGRLPGCRPRRSPAGAPARRRGGRPSRRDPRSTGHRGTVRPPHPRGTRPERRAGRGPPRQPVRRPHAGGDLGQDPHRHRRRAVRGPADHGPRTPREPKPSGRRWAQECPRA